MNNALLTDPARRVLEVNRGFNLERQETQRTILLVEDESFVRQVTSEILCSAGYEVIAAQNSGEASMLYAQQEGQIHLLLTDVILPGETGFSLAAKLWRRNPGLEVLFMTGYAEQMGRSTEKHRILAKPFTGEELLSRVWKCLESLDAVAFPEHASTQLCACEWRG